MAALQWVPPAGLATFVEPLDPEPGCDGLTGIVMEGSGVVIDLGASPRPTATTFDAVASFFTHDALYRITGVMTAVERGGSRYELVAKELEAVQRRVEPRADVSLPVALSNLDGPGPLVSVKGVTRNVSSGGCRVLTEQPFPPGADPTVALHLDEEETVIARAAILQRNNLGERFDYRLVFTEIDLDDRVRLATLAS